VRTLLLLMLALGVGLPPPALLAEEIATVASLAGEAAAGAEQDFVVYTWQGLVTNRTLSRIEATVVLVFRAEDGATVGDVPLEALELGRREERETGVILEIDLPTWSRIHSVRPEIASAKRLTDPQTVSDAKLVSDVRSSEEKQGDLARRREQLQSKIDRLERAYADRRTDYEIAKARIGPFGLLDSSSKDSRKLEREMERASKALQDAAQDLREAQRELQALR